MFLTELLTNKIFLTIIFAGLGVQIIKVLIFLIKHKKHLYFKDLFVTGGMPSSHSALVVSLVVIIFLVEGFSTTLFLALALAAIVIRDAMGVRRTAGEEGKLLNEMIKKTKVKIPKVHYALGHTPAEVLVGSVLGVLVAIVVYFV